jgi:hypothetical protein
LATGVKLRACAHVRPRSAPCERPRARAHVRRLNDGLGRPCRQRAAGSGTAAALGNAAAGRCGLGATAVEAVDGGGGLGARTAAASGAEGLRRGGLGLSGAGQGRGARRRLVRRAFGEVARASGGAGGQGAAWAGRRRPRTWAALAQGGEVPAATGDAGQGRGGGGVHRAALARGDGPGWRRRWRAVRAGCSVCVGCV